MLVFRGCTCNFIKNELSFISTGLEGLFASTKFAVFLEATTLLSWDEIHHFRMMKKGSYVMKSYEIHPNMICLLYKKKVVGFMRFRCFSR